MSGKSDLPIGQRLRRQRIEMLGKGLREMAAILGITPPHLTDIEKGRRAPSEELLRRIVDHYRLPEAELRSAWSKPDAVVNVVANQDSLTAAKVPEFLRMARNLNAQQWDNLIRQAQKMSKGEGK